MVYFVREEDCRGLLERSPHRGVSLFLTRFTIAIILTNNPYSYVKIQKFMVGFLKPTSERSSIVVYKMLSHI